MSSSPEPPPPPPRNHDPNDSKDSNEISEAECDRDQLVNRNYGGKCSELPIHTYSFSTSFQENTIIEI